MTPPRSIIGAIGESRYLRNAWRRRAIVGVLLVICAVLTFFPERYRAAMTLTPSDPQSLGLGTALGQLGAQNTVFGNQAALEIALKVARSAAVRQTVIRKLDIVKREELTNEREADRWLERRIGLRSLRGGIIQMEFRDGNPVYARDLVAAYAAATQDKLAEIARRQTAYKRNILIKLVRQSGDRLDAADQVYNNFRLRTRSPEPRLAIESVTGRIEQYRSDIQATEVQLSAARRFATDDNLAVAQLIAKLQALRRQLSDALAQNPQTPESLGRVVAQSTQVRRLERELVIARTLYDGYTRLLEGTSVEDLTSQAVVRVLEPTYIDAARQLNWAAAAIGLLVLLIALAVEFYQLRPPVGSDRVRHAE